MLASGRSMNRLENHGVSQLAGAARVTPLPVAIDIPGQFPVLEHPPEEDPGFSFPQSWAGLAPGALGFPGLVCPGTRPSQGGVRPRGSASARAARY